MSKSKKAKDKIQISPHPCGAGSKELRNIEGKKGRIMKKTGEKE